MISKRGIVRINIVIYIVVYEEKIHCLSRVLDTFIENLKINIGRFNKLPKISINVTYTMNQIEKSITQYDNNKPYKIQDIELLCRKTQEFTQNLERDYGLSFVIDNNDGFIKILEKDEWRSFFKELVLKIDEAQLVKDSFQVNIDIITFIQKITLHDIESIEMFSG